MTQPLVTAKVEGEKKLTRVMQQLPRRVASKVTRKAVNAGARIVSRDAKRMAPRGKTKLLSKSIGVKGKTTKQGYYAKIGTRRGFAITGPNGRKYDPVRIVHLEEKGTQPHQIPVRGLLARRLRTKSIQHPGARPHPFIRPALENNLGQVQGTIRGRLWEGIQQEAKAI